MRSVKAWEIWAISSHVSLMRWKSSSLMPSGALSFEKTNSSNCSCLRIVCSASKNLGAFRVSIYYGDLFFMPLATLRSGSGWIEALARAQNIEDALFNASSVN